MTKNKKIKISHNDIDLNLVFRLISTFLSYSQSFNHILEYSLLSKKHFEIFQNILSYDNVDCNIILDYFELQNYIIISKNTKKYEKKLLQYKDIHYIKIYQNNEFQLEKEYKYFKTNFKKLEKVHLMNYFDGSYGVCDDGYSYGSDEEEDAEEEEEQPKRKGRKTNKNKKPIKKEKEDKLALSFNPSFNGYFIFDKLELKIGPEYNPVSNRKEFKDSRFWDDNELGMEGYPFSFNFLLQYNPRKLLLNGIFFSEDTFQQLSNILICESIESIETDKGYPILNELQFLKDSLKSPNIKSLSLNIPIKKLFNYQDVFKGLKESKIKKLCLFKTNNIKTEKLPPNVKPLDIFYNYIKDHQYLSTISLDMFQIVNKAQYEPLLEIRNIKTLHSTFDSPKELVNHILSNPNIEKVVLHILDTFPTIENDGHLLKLIKKLKNGTNNCHNLKELVIKDFNYDEGYYLEMVKMVEDKYKNTCRDIAITIKKGKITE